MIGYMTKLESTRKVLYHPKNAVYSNAVLLVKASAGDLPTLAIIKATCPQWPNYPASIRSRQGTTNMPGKCLNLDVNI